MSDISEATARTAVGRAYYAVYGSASQRAATRGYKRKSSPGGSHNQLWDYFENEAGRRTGLDAATTRAIASHGRFLKEMRKTADYEPNVTVAKVDAEQAVTIAEALLTKITRWR